MQTPCPGRRSFLKAIVAAGVAPAFIPASALGADGRPAPSERITMGFVGVGGRGGGDMQSFIGFPEVQGVAVCDVDRRARESAQKVVNARYQNTSCAAFVDYRELVSRPDIDAVFCGTPDHWHALITLDAMRNGKDVFCEKPETLTIRQGQEMLATARRYGRVFAGGSQRVWGDYNIAHRIVRGGAIGDVKEVWVGCGGPSDEMQRPAQPVPAGLDWDRWLGPAPWRPYNPDYHPARWRGCRDFSGGGMTDWGAHCFGGALFACNLQESGPVEIYPPDGKEHKTLTYIFPNGVRFYHGRIWPEATLSFHGTRGEITEKGPRDRNARLEIPSIHIPNYKHRAGIFGDFIQCVRTRERPFRDIALAHKTLIVCHLGNIAYWLKRPLKWDPVKEEFIGDAEASRWLDRPMRAPYRL